ncbi:hypothetical protein D3C71_2176770 [compost metagenome]
MLVVRGTKARSDLRRVGVVLVRECCREHDARSLRLKLDGAVQIEVPVEAVIVVAHGGEEGDH